MHGLGDVVPSDDPYLSTDPTLKRIDAWWTVLFIDPFAVRLVRLVHGRPWVTPTRLTVVAHALGLVSAALLAVDQLLLAAAVFEVRFVIDCADGKLARVRNTSSEAGAHLDYEGDYLIVMLHLIAMGAWLDWHGDTTALLSAALPAAFVASITAARAVGRLGTMRRVSDATPGRYQQWMTDRRLRPLPSRVDVEHGLLFVAPLVAVMADAAWPIEAAAGGATAYFTYSTVRSFWAGLRLAEANDRAAPR